MGFCVGPCSLEKLDRLRPLFRYRNGTLLGNLLRAHFTHTSRERQRDGGLTLQREMIQPNWAKTDDRWRFLGLDLMGWSIFSLGAILTLAIVNFMLIQPTLRQLARLEHQVDYLETSVGKLTGQAKHVAATNSLLGQLAEQGRRQAEANRSLESIATLSERLNQETRRAEKALAVMERLASLEDALLQNAPSIDEATAALGSIERLQMRLADGRTATEDGHRALDGIELLRDD